MGKRYQAPLHTTAVFSPNRELRADENGIIELDDEAPESDHEALRRAGCVEVADEAAVEVAVEAPVKPKPSGGGVQKGETAPEQPEA